MGWQALGKVAVSQFKTVTKSYASKIRSFRNAQTVD